MAITPGQELKFILVKVKKRLWHWANHLLSFTSRAIMLKHVFRAIPLYHLMILELYGGGYKMLEKIGKDFLWGMSPNGCQKKFLMA